MRAHGGTLIEKGEVASLSDTFFKSLPSLTNWNNGLVPCVFLDHHEIADLRIQDALSRHRDVEIRKRIARGNIDDDIRWYLENDKDEGVRIAASEGRNASCSASSRDCADATREGAAT